MKHLLKTKYDFCKKQQIYGFNKVFINFFLYFSKRVKVRLNEKTGLIKSISVDGNERDLEQEILWYAAREPQVKNYTRNLARRPSGLYVFRPNHTDAFPIRKQEGVSISIYKGFGKVKI